MIDSRIQSLFDTIKLSEDIKNYFILYNNYCAVNQLINNINLFILFTHDNKKRNLEQFKKYVKSTYSLNVENVMTYEELIALLQNLKNIFLTNAMNIVKNNYNNKIQKEIEKKILDCVGNCN